MSVSERKIMKVSKEGLAEIASHEGIVSSRYRDSKNIWTIGIGHTASAGKPNPADVQGELSVAEIMDIFTRDVANFERRVNRAFNVPLTQAQFDAAVSFDLNTGGIHKATWVKQYNAGQRSAARKSFMNWSKPPEIIERREAERDLFFDGTYSSNGMATMYPANARGSVQWGQGKRVNVARLMDEAVRIEDAVKQAEAEISPQKPAGEQKPIPAPSQPKPPVSQPQGKSGGKTGWIAGIIAALAGLAAWFWDKLESLWSAAWPF